MFRCSFELPVVEAHVIEPDSRDCLVLCDRTSYLDELTMEWSYHVRSRFAQAGIGIELVDVDPKTVAFHVNHYGRRPLSIPEETPFARIYSYDCSDLVTGPALREAIEKNQIRFEGEHGIDWGLISEESQTQCSPDIFPWGAWMRIGERKYVPKEQRNTEPMRLHNILDYRTILDTYVLEETNGLNGHDFWVGQTTSSLFLNHGIHAEIQPLVFVDGQHQTHVSSQLLFGGSTDWPIRVEFVSETHPTGRKIPHIPPNAIPLMFLRA
jgi:hypothetical protein